MREMAGKHEMGSKFLNGLCLGFSKYITIPLLVRLIYVLDISCLCICTVVSNFFFFFFPFVRGLYIKVFPILPFFFSSSHILDYLILHIPESPPFLSLFMYDRLSFSLCANLGPDVLVIPFVKSCHVFKKKGLGYNKIVGYFLWT